MFTKGEFVVLNGQVREPWMGWSLLTKLRNLIDVLEVVAPLVWFCCFVVVVVKMFQMRRKGLGIACILLAVCGAGFLIHVLMERLHPVSSGATGIGLPMLFPACTSALFFVIAGGIAFIWGWSNSGGRSIRYVMWAWTGFILLPLLLIIISLFFLTGV